MRISDWSSDVCSSDLGIAVAWADAALLKAARVSATLEEAVRDQRIFANADHAAAAAADADGPFLEDRVVVAGADDAAQEAAIAAEAEDFGAQAADESFVGIEARIAGVVGQLVVDAGPQEIGRASGGERVW